MSDTTERLGDAARLVLRGAMTGPERAEIYEAINAGYMRILELEAAVQRLEAALGGRGGAS